MANLETGQLVATATHVVRSEAPTGILFERDSDKIASRQWATSLLGHLRTSPDDNNPRGTSVGDSITQTPREPAVSLTDCSTKQSRETRNTRRVAQIQL